jgi:HEAT repeat protein
MQDQRWRAEAQNVTIPKLQPEELRKWLRCDNPHARARVVSHLVGLWGEEQEELVEVLAPAVRDVWLPVRQAALAFLKKRQSPTRKRLLSVLARDADEWLRDEAALELARYGQRPDQRQIERLLQSSERAEAYKVLAPLADRDLFVLMLRFPFLGSEVGDDGLTYEDLGLALRKHPEAIDDLLLALVTEDQRQNEAATFAERVIRHAGKPARPALYKALASPSPWVRTGAARTCVALDDAAAVPHLRKALVLEKGLARHAIAEALLELGGSEAVPKGIDLPIEKALTGDPDLDGQQRRSWQGALRVPRGP